MKFFLLFLFCFSALAAEFVPGEYIVKTHNKSVLKSFKPLSNDLYKVKLTEAEAKALEPKVEYIEPNYIYHAYSTPAGQWGLPAIDAEKAWKITKGDLSIIVGVIDTGVDYTHSALKSHIWTNKGEIPNNGIDDDKNGYIDDVRGWNFADNTNDPMDTHYHGTHCSGIVAADSPNTLGIAPKITIMPIKFLDKNGSGTLEGAIGAINYGVANGANVLSNSWGGGSYSQALRDAIINAKEKGVIFIAAAGNDGSDNDSEPSYPASYTEDNVISVGASDISGNKASFSNWGKSSVHLFAPGVNIVSTVPGNKTMSLSGTSMATPYVSGVAALIISQDKSCDYICVKDKLMEGTKPSNIFTDISISGGLLNAYQSLK